MKFYNQVNLLFGLSAALSIFVDTDFVVCLMAHYFTGFLTTCSPIPMNGFFYAHTGYLSYVYQLEGSTVYQSKAKQREFFCASIIILLLS